MDQCKKNDTSEGIHPKAEGCLQPQRLLEVQKKALPFDSRQVMGWRRQQQFDLAKGQFRNYNHPNYRLHILPYQEDWGFSAWSPTNHSLEDFSIRGMPNRAF